MLSERSCEQCEKSFSVSWKEYAFPINDDGEEFEIVDENTEPNHCPFCGEESYEGDLSD